MNKKQYIQVEKIKKKPKKVITEAEKLERIISLAEKMKIKLGEDK